MDRVKDRLRELGSAIESLHAAVREMAGDQPNPKVEEHLGWASSHLQTFGQMQQIEE